MPLYSCVYGMGTMDLKTNSVFLSKKLFVSLPRVFLLYQQGWSLKVPSLHCFICWPHELTRSEPFERPSTARTSPTSWIWLPPSLSLQWSSISRCVQTHHREIRWSGLSFGMSWCVRPHPHPGWCSSPYSIEVVGWHLKGAGFHGSWSSVFHWVVGNCLN